MMKKKENLNLVIKKNNILCNNICFKYIDKNFKVKSEEEIEVSLEKNSIIFCEVKNSFINIDGGNENCSKIQINKSNDNENIDNGNITYIDQIENLLKKSKLFYNFFVDEKIIDKNKYMHILYLYDENNIFFENLISENIKYNIIINILKTQSFPKEFKEIIFQLAYFDTIKNKQYKEKYFNELLEKKDKEIKDKDNALVEKNKKIEKLRKLLEDYNIKYDS